MLAPARQLMQDGQEEICAKLLTVPFSFKGESYRLKHPHTFPAPLTEKEKKKCFSRLMVKSNLPRRSQGGRPFPPSPFAARAHPYLPVSEQGSSFVSDYLPRATSSHRSPITHHVNFCLPNNVKSSLPTRVKFFLPYHVKNCLPSHVKKCLTFTLPAAD